MAAGVRPKKIGKVNLFKIDWTGKEKKETSPVYNISGEIDGVGEISGAGWVSKTKAGETYLSCNINEPFQKDGQAQSSSVKDDELPF
ncbi:hypothetical protein [uncultured Mediterranean phage uvMED]|jgi:uncharacterized protein (DUF736 family)|nr:hypothetical protein [uncultured Mediterranean phage uvMED]